MKKRDERIKVIFEEYLDKHVKLQDLARDFEQLTPEKRLVMLEKFASYIWPKMKSVAMDVSHEEFSTAMVSLVRHLSEHRKP